MSHIELAEGFRGSTLRIEQLIFIAALDGVETHDTFRLFCESMDNCVEAPDHLIKDLPFLSKWFGDDDRDEDLFEDEMEALFEQFVEARKLGFLAQVAHPIMHGSAFTWGHYGTQWFYGESMEEILAKGVAWAKEMDEECSR